MEITPLKCQSITPMFIGNADTKKAELRPSAFEGVLRFWWRALHPTLNYKELLKAEAEFFGGHYYEATENNKTVNHLPSYRFLKIEYAKNDISDTKIDERPDKTFRSEAFQPNKPFKIYLQILRWSYILSLRN